jgi:hypothetical protein
LHVRDIRWLVDSNRRNPMNCYVCDENGRATAAVAICQHCGAALCKEHLDEDLLAHRPHGVVKHIGCGHHLVHEARERRGRATQAAQ